MVLIVVVVEKDMERVERSEVLEKFVQGEESGVLKYDVSTYLVYDND